MPRAIETHRRPKVLFFDVNETLLDLTAMKADIAAVLGNDALAPLWFTTMLQYSLVATVGGHYFDFGAVGAAALQMVAANAGVSLDEARAKEAVRGVLRLPAHDDVKAALTTLKQAGFTLVSFTNSSRKTVDAQFAHAGLTEFFDERLSIETVQKFKPHLDAYAWAAQTMRVDAADCMLVAAHGWDIAGAAWAGWRTAFVARPGAQKFPLAPPPELEGSTLTPLVERLLALR